MKTEELDAATVSILKTPENAQTPIELPEEEEARKTPPRSRPFRRKSRLRRAAARRTAAWRTAGNA